MAFKARFKSTCLFCGVAITPGQWATWSRREKGKYVHQGCQDARAGISSPVPPDLTDTPDTSPESQGEAEGALDALAGALSRRLKLDTPATLDEARVKALAREVLDEQAPTQIIIGQDGREPVIVEGAHEAFPRLAYLAGLGRPIYLYGAHGTGKSYAARQLALALGRPFGYASLTKQSPVSLLLGYMDAQGRYVRTVFRDAYEHGHVFCQDELDNASPNYLSALNTPLENGHCAFPDGMVEQHKDFIFIGTGNTSGKGPNPAYPERSPFDAAFGDRFHYLAWGTDEKLERTIAKTINPNASAWVVWVQQVRAWCMTTMPRVAPSPRTSFRLATFLQDKVLDRESALDAALWHGIGADVRDKILANVPYPTTWPTQESA